MISNDTEPNDEAHPGDDQSSSPIEKELAAWQQGSAEALALVEDLVRDFAPPG